MTARTAATALAGVREHVGTAIAQYDVPAPEITVHDGDRPRVRALIADPSWRHALAPVVITGPVAREVFETPDGRIEVLSGPSRFDESVLVVLFGRVRPHSPRSLRTHRKA